jgi:hypothetical protein
MEVKKVETHADLRRYLKSNLPYPKPLEGIIDRIIMHTERRNFLQILYTFRIDALQVLMKYFLEVENYELCQAIHSTVEMHKKATGENYNLYKE